MKRTSIAIALAALLLAPAGVSGKPAPGATLTLLDTNPVTIAVTSEKYGSRNDSYVFSISCTNGFTSGVSWASNPGGDTTLTWEISGPTSCTASISFDGTELDSISFDVL